MTDYKISKDEFYITRDLADIKVGDTIEIVTEKTGSDIVRELLKEGKPVLCYVSNDSQSEADKERPAAYSVAIDRYHNGHFREYNAWKYVSPIDTSKFASYVPEVDG